MGTVSILTRQLVPCPSSCPASLTAAGGFQVARGIGSGRSKEVVLVVACLFLHSQISAQFNIIMCLTAVQVSSPQGQWAAARSPLGGGKAGGTVVLLLVLCYPRRRPCLGSGQVRSGQVHYSAEV